METITNRAPCPNCGSHSVRWRNRRFYDGALNFIETMLTGATVVRTNDGISPYAHSGMDAGFMRDRQIQEQKRMIGRKTARLFWRCPDCKQHGEGTEEL
jgi:endogenous inhibitor of DNA gyrase (YacG/DUF329 family)